MDKEFIAAGLTSIIGLAIIAVIFSKRANTAPVIQAAGSAFGNILSVAVSPISATTPAPIPGAASAGTSPTGAGPTSNVNFASPGGFGNFTGGNIALPNVSFPNLSFPNINFPSVSPVINS